MTKGTNIRLDHAFVASKIGPWLTANADTLAQQTTPAIARLAMSAFDRKITAASVRNLMQAMRLTYRAREKGAADASTAGIRFERRIVRLEGIVKRLCSELGIVCADLGGTDE